MQHQYVHAPSGSLVTVVFVFVTVGGRRRCRNRAVDRTYVRPGGRSERRPSSQQGDTHISLDRIFAAVSRPAGV
jgi:hypothetical protein